jgi:hypothetical protein
MSIARKLIPSDSAQVFPFVFRITTTSANTVFTVPLVDYAGLTPSLNIGWGDGNTSPLITSSTDVNRVHTYVSPGTYTITISGFMPGTELVQWGIVGLRTVDFYGCINLTSIPGSASLSGVGGYTGLSEVSVFTSTFRGTGITSIPSDLFDYSPNATTITDTFTNTAITSIPSGLFDNVLNVTNFASCFSGCTQLSTVPSDLFDLNVSVVNFSSTFRNCLAITTPLQFTYNTSVLTFNNLYNMSTTANAMTGTAPELWNRSPAPSGTDAFRNCLNLTNYASIPTIWK